MTLGLIGGMSDLAYPPSISPLDQRGQRLVRRLARASDEARFVAVSQPQRLHLMLFRGEAMSGQVRGFPGGALRDQEAVVRIPRVAAGMRNCVRCTAAAQVPEAMAVWQRKIAAFWANPGDATTARLAWLTWHFFQTHPFADGNGRVFRMVLPLLAARANLQMGSDWRVSPRPYGDTLSLCLQQYRAHPKLLEWQVQAWLAPHETVWRTQERRVYIQKP